MKIETRDVIARCTATMSSLQLLSQTLADADEASSNKAAVAKACTVLSERIQKLRQLLSNPRTAAVKAAPAPAKIVKPLAKKKTIKAPTKSSNKIRRRSVKAKALTAPES